MSKNLLIFQLSTMYKISPTDYADPQGETVSTEGYQLEPVLRYLARTVGVHRVLMITTSETDSAEQHLRDKVLPVMENKAGVVPEVVTHSLGEREIANLQDLNKIVNLIKDYVQENPHEVEIYIDTHGGARSNAEMMTPIFSLLPMEDIVHRQWVDEKGEEHKDIEHIRIKPENVYTVVYNSRNQKKNRIASVGQSYDLMDLVAGVHEFVEYGRTESLDRYARKRRDNQALRDLVKAMKSIADALAIGDVSAFEDDVQVLQTRLDAYQGTDGTSSQILANLVHQEYDAILHPDADVITQIQWCRDKKFYQLAMVICESKALEYLESKKRMNLDAIRGDEPKEFKREKRVNAFVNNWQSQDVDNLRFYYMEFADSAVFKINKDHNDSDKRYFLYCKDPASEDNRYLRDFLQKHRKIKATRNGASHADEFKGDKMYRTANALNNAFGTYLEDIKYIIDKSNLHLVMAYFKKNETYAQFRQRNPKVPLSADGYDVMMKLCKLTH